VLAACQRRPDLRFDVPVIHAALDAQRVEREMDWTSVAREIGGLYSKQTLSRMGQPTRTTVPAVIRLARWLRVPAAMLTHVAA